MSFVARVNSVSFFLDETDTRFFCLGHDDRQTTAQGSLLLTILSHEKTSEVTSK